MTFVTVVLISVLGMLAGMIFTYFLLHKENGQEVALRQELDEVKKSFDQYRARVNGDYLKTAGLLNEMTERYREVHQHLAQSAEALCSEGLERPHLDLLSQGADLIIESDATDVVSPMPAEQSVAQTEARFH